MNVKNVDRRYKADRLGYIVNRMRVRQDITPAQLAQELNVSERTVYRDLRSLESGSALQKRYSRREGRYLLENELNLPPLVLSPSEALALFSAASNPALSPENFFASDLRAALIKVAQAFDPCDAEAEEQTSQAKSGPASTGEKPLAVTRDSIQRPLMETVRRAMRSNCKLSLRYWPADGTGERTHVVSPYDLRVRKESSLQQSDAPTQQETAQETELQNPMSQEQETEHWYLLANAEGQGVKTFKISRIRNVQMLAERFRFPRHVSEDARFDRAWATAGSEQGVRVVARFARGVAKLALESRAHQFTCLRTDPDGSMVCAAWVNDCAEVAWWLLAYGDQAEALSPPELRVQFARTAHQMSALYARPNTLPSEFDNAASTHSEASAIPVGE